MKLFVFSGVIVVVEEVAVTEVAEEVVSVEETEEAVEVVVGQCEVAAGTFENKNEKNLFSIQFKLYY